MCIILEKAVVPEELKQIVLEAEDVSEADVVEWAVTLHRNGRWDVSVQYRTDDPAVEFLSTYCAEIDPDETLDDPYWHLVWLHTADLESENA